MLLWMVLLTLDTGLQGGHGLVVPRSGAVHYSACFDANAGSLFSQVVAPGSSWPLETLEHFLLPMVKLRSWLNPTSPVSPSLLMHYFPRIPPRAGVGQFLLSVGSDVGCCLGARRELPGRRGGQIWSGWVWSWPLHGGGVGSMLKAPLCSAIHSFLSNT